MQGGWHLWADWPYIWWYQHTVELLLLECEGAGLGEWMQLLHWKGSDLTNCVRFESSLLSLSTSSLRLEEWTVETDWGTATLAILSASCANSFSEMKLLVEASTILTFVESLCRNSWPWPFGPLMFASGPEPVYNARSRDTRLLNLKPSRHRMPGLITYMYTNRYGRTLTIFPKDTVIC